MHILPSTKTDHIRVYTRYRSVHTVIYCWLFFAVGFMSCKQEWKVNIPDSNTAINPQLSQHHPWQPLQCGLYKNAEGEIAFASDPDIAFIPEEDLEGERCPNRFITQLGSYENEPLLVAIIDTTTFETLGACMYKDKNHLYHYLPMCGGGPLNIFADDTSGFTLLSNQYFKYQSKIYYWNSAETQADPETFRAFDIGIAKDKHGYFTFNERISEEDLRANLGEEAYLELKMEEGEIPELFRIFLPDVSND